jgi:hypothetical protein
MWVCVCVRTLSVPALVMMVWRSGGTPVSEKSCVLNMSGGSVGSSGTSSSFFWPHLTDTVHTHTHTHARTERKRDTGAQEEAEYARSLAQARRSHAAGAPRGPARTLKRHRVQAGRWER